MAAHEIDQVVSAVSEVCRQHRRDAVSAISESRAVVQQV
jgi:hypothetical protein